MLKYINNKWNEAVTTLDKTEKKYARAFTALSSIGVYRIVSEFNVVVADSLFGFAGFVILFMWFIHIAKKQKKTKTVSENGEKNITKD